MRGSGKFFQRGSNVDYVFLVDIDISGPLSSRQRNAIEMAFRWRDDGGPLRSPAGKELHFLALLIVVYSCSCSLSHIVFRDK